MAQCKKLPMAEDGIVRLSRIEVYPQYLDEYMKLANEVGATSLRTEPGVLTMYAWDSVTRITDSIHGQLENRKHAISLKPLSKVVSISSTQP